MSSGNCFINEGTVTGYQDKKQAIRTQTQIGVSSEKLLSNFERSGKRCRGSVSGSLCAICGKIAAANATLSVTGREFNLTTSKPREENLAPLSYHAAGVDIDAEQLMAAPQGAYSTTIVSALERYEGAPHDYVVAQSGLEHVSDGREAMAGIGRLLRPGGKVFTFCPNKRAWFARLNKLLPERLKRAILFSIYLLFALSD